MRICRNLTESLLQPSVLELALLGGQNWEAGSSSKRVPFDLCLVSRLRIPLTYCHFGVQSVSPVFCIF